MRRKHTVSVDYHLLDVCCVQGTVIPPICIILCKLHNNPWGAGLLLPLVYRPGNLGSEWLSNSTKARKLVTQVPSTNLQVPS